MPDSTHPSKDRPSNITLDREAHELRITWKSDGHLSVYPLDALREACPCASCRGGHDKMGREHDPDLIELTPARKYEVTNAELVGRYAIQLHFDDGHSGGLYTWEYLRRLCPCEACREARRRGEMP